VQLARRACSGGGGRPQSFSAPPADDSCVIGRTEYGIAFPSVLARENLMATQFHPEKSGRWGIMLLRNFVQLAGEAA